MKRRTFLALGAGTALEVSLQKSPLALGMAGLLKKSKEPFKISLAQWSLNRRLFGKKGPKLDNLDFAKTARGFGIKGLEYVNQFFKDKAGNAKYLAEMKKCAADNGCKSVLIMCDGEGNLGDPDSNKRIRAVENHYKWLEAAGFLGCHSIRVNAYSEGTYDEQLKLVTDGLYRLCEYATQYKLNVIVENHGGFSSNGEWLTGVIKAVNQPNCGTLPDFGNFPAGTDRYEAVRMFMPYARGVSAKSMDFDEKGNETSIDFYRIMRIVCDSGYNGYVGIEYSGSRLSEDEGILATKQLLEKIREQMIKAGSKIKN